MGCQIVHDSLTGRGFGDLFLIRLDSRVAGNGFAMGYRGEPPLCDSAPMFRRLIHASEARRGAAHTKDALLVLMLYDCATDILMLYDCATDIMSDADVFRDAPRMSLLSGVLAS